MQHTSYRKHRERRSPDRHFRFSGPGVFAPCLFVFPSPPLSPGSAKRSLLRPSFLRPAAPPRAQKRSPVRSFDWTGLYTWRRPTLTGPIVPLPSALRRFTSGFGMGPGGYTALWSPEGGPVLCQGRDSGDLELMSFFSVSFRLFVPWKGSPLADIHTESAFLSILQSLQLLQAIHGHFSFQFQK